jgi:lipoprotein signal peptidase
MVEPEAPTPPSPRANPLFRRVALLVAVSALVIVADQATKRVVEQSIRGRTVRVMPGFDLRYARNPGAAWGLLADVRERYRRPFFIGVSVLAMAFIVFTYSRASQEQRRLRLALALILGGAIGNFIDRMAYGYVVDFVDWHARLFGRVRHWPTFNIADAGITVGVLLLALDIFPRRTRREAAPIAEDSRGERAEGEGSARPGRGEGELESPSLENAKPDGAEVEVRK